MSPIMLLYAVIVNALASCISASEGYPKRFDMEEPREPSGSTRVLHQHVRSMTYGPTSECCGSSIIDTASQVCCSGVARPRSLGPATARCCGTYAYDPDASICCLPHEPPRPRDHGPFTVCCGGSTTYDGRSNETACCGDRFVYNVTEQVCCADSVQLIRKTFGRYTACCGSKAFDYRHRSCCGNRLYDDDTARTKICCGGVLGDRTGPTVECCGTSAYDARSQICCNGTALMDRLHGSDSACCGTTAFDRRTHRCCYAESPFRAPVRGLGTPTETYDPAVQVCCASGTVVRKPSSVEDDDGELSCCADRAFAEDAFNICCGGVVGTKVYGYNSECCGTAVIDGRMQMCCRGAVREKRFGDSETSCCGSDVYNATASQCCDGVVRDRMSANGRYLDCCGQSEYDRGSQLCCTFGGLEIGLADGINWQRDRL